MPERAVTAALQSYLPDDAPQSPVRPRRPPGASGRQTDPVAEFERQFEELASRWCTAEEISAVLGVSEESLDRYVSEVYGLTLQKAIKRLQARGKASLRRLQWKLAEEQGSVAMAIFLGKNHLDQSDAPKVSSDRPPVAVVLIPGSINPADWQTQMTALEQGREARVRRAMEAAGLMEVEGRLLEDGEGDALELPKRVVGTRER